MKSIEDKTKNKESIFERISFFFMYGRPINSNVPIYSPLVYGKIKPNRNYQK
ncbi:MAG: hypothetical protein WC511_04950 [Candidatus Pacearchaeota archaeon]|jgi:hypothetical protein